ncbi:MAG: tRNA dimethylallyltransferase, mitochondrial, partial [Paramarteilia canceri]
TLNTRYRISQSIGFKEFLPYLALDESSDSSKKAKILEHCKILMLRRTLRYAKKQMKYVEKELIP